MFAISPNSLSPTTTRRAATSMSACGNNKKRRVFNSTPTATKSEAERKQALNAVPAWFRLAVASLYNNVGRNKNGGGGEESYEEAFRTTYTSIQHFSKPSVLKGLDAECQLVHISKTDICLCTRKLMHIPFQVRMHRT